MGRNLFGVDISFVPWTQGRRCAPTLGSVSERLWRSYLFSAPTENSPGARDLSRRNAGKADPRLEFQDSLADQIFLRTKVRAPFARPANTLNTYAAVSAAATSAGPGA